MGYSINHLRELESEAIYVLREVAAQFENPCILFSGGKDSILLTHLAKKAFYPAKIPFPLVHIDTGHNFPETLTFRDDLAKELQAKLIVGSVQSMIDSGMAHEETGANASRNIAQIPTLLNTIEEHKFDALMGGARRDEEKAQPKSDSSLIEMNLANGILKISVLSYGTSTMEKSIMESTSVYSQLAIGLNLMYGSISEWRILPCPPYTMPISAEFLNVTVLFYPNRHLSPCEKGKRFERRLCDSALWEMLRLPEPTDLDADTIDKIIQEVAAARSTERGSRADDKRSETAMEDRKKEGYF